MKARSVYAKLTSRRKAWDALSTEAKKGTKRPGSMNARKQA